MRWSPSLNEPIKLFHNISQTVSIGFLRSSSARAATAWVSARRSGSPLLMADRSGTRRLRPSATRVPVIPACISASARTPLVKEIQHHLAKPCGAATHQRRCRPNSHHRRAEILKHFQRRRAPKPRSQVAATSRSSEHAANGRDQRSTENALAFAFHCFDLAPIASVISTAPSAAACSACFFRANSARARAASCGRPT